MKDDARDAFGSELARRQAVLDSLKADLLGLPLAEAMARIVMELRLQGVFMTMGEVELHARMMSNPRWALRHPIRARREAQRLLGSIGDPDLEFDSSEADELSRRFSAQLDPGTLLDYLEISTRRTMDGQVHVITIDPYSDALAAILRSTAAPILVEVRGVNKRT